MGFFFTLYYFELFYLFIRSALYFFFFMFQFSTVCTELPGSYPNLSGGCRAGVRCGDFPEFPDFPGARGARGVRGA